MARLIFFDQSHEYQVDGENLPSVSEITRFISREIYGNIVQFRVDQAAERGTKVHKALEAIDKYGSAEIDESIVGYIKAYLAFRREHQCEWVLIENALYHPQKGYAGTVDRYGIVDGSKAIVDFKTSCTVQKALYGAGQNLYRQMLEANWYEVEKLYILHLKPDGTYKPIELDCSDDVADACLVLHNALKKKRRKRKDATNGQ